MFKPIVVSSKQAQQLSEVVGETAVDKPIFVAFTDYECPPCYTLHRKIKSGKKIAIISMHYPLTGIHPNAFRAAQLAEAARDQSRFVEMNDLLFSSGGKISPSVLRSFLQIHRMNARSFEAFMNTQADKVVKRHVELARKWNITGTPTLLKREKDGSLHQISVAELETLLQ